MSFDDVDPAVVERYFQRVGWNPSDESGEWVLMMLTPTRGQAWNGPGEMTGRTFIRSGRWLDSDVRDV